MADTRACEQCDAPATHAYVYQDGGDTGFWCDQHADGLHLEKLSPAEMALAVRRQERHEVISALAGAWRARPEASFCVFLKEVLGDYPARHGDEELLRALEAFAKETR